MSKEKKSFIRKIKKTKKKEMDKKSIVITKDSK